MNVLCQKILEGERPSLDQLIQAFHPYFPLLLQLKTTPQEPDWHAEGNVHIHTEMVLMQMYKILDKDALHLCAQDKLSLILAALLHDIAKPITTKTMDIRGVIRIAAPQHEYKGASYIAYKLASLSLPFTVIYTVIELVAQHLLPKFLVIKSMPSHKYHRLSRLVRLDLLYYLEMADMTGRECLNKSEQLEHLELFKLFAQEYQAWNTIPKRYLDWDKTLKTGLGAFSDEARDLIFGNAILRSEEGLILTIEEEIARSFSYRNQFAQLFIFCGPSGSGKSSWITKHFENIEIISLDSLRKKLTGSEEDQSQNGQVMQAAKKALKEALRDHKIVAWDATNLRRDYRSIIADLGYAYNALVTLVVFYGREEYFFQRNQMRTRKVPTSVFKKQLERLEWPEAIEAHRYIVIGEEGEELFSTGFGVVA